MAKDAAPPASGTLFGYLDPKTGNFIPALPASRAAPTHDAAGGPIFRRGTLAWALTDPAGTMHVTAQFTPYLAANPTSGIYVIFSESRPLPANGATTIVNVPVRF